MDKLSSIDMERTGQKIKKLRKKRGISIKELQNELGLASKSSLYHWENGKKMPNLEHLKDLANIFEVYIDDILVFKDKGE